MKYKVLIPEVYISTRLVEAESPEEALEIAGDETEISCEYSYSLEEEYWEIESVT